ncbi:MAG: lysophospholipid acyltransferase family protein [Candidatus Firestonebacteria bacterium]|nr:lysophospholipid acyltransferase family protein [Candidatus Firestonebacteria bacterium]
MKPGLEKQPFKYHLIMSLMPLGAWLVKLLFATVRVRLIDPNRLAPRNKPASTIYAFWHEHQVLAMSTFRHWGVFVLVSRSRDGDYVSKVLDKFGFHTVRSSSSNGKLTALRGLARELSRGAHVTITPDGPRGPRHSCQPGPVFLGAMTGAKVVPFGCAVDRAWRLKSWDRFEIPKPFSRAAVVFGTSLQVPEKLDADLTATLVAELEQSLKALETQARASLKAAEPA